jgi:hypothetical protein
LPEARDSQGQGVLYDFVYLDRKRLAFLAAQLFDQGLLTSTRLSSARDSSDKLDFRMDAAVAKGGHEGVTTVREAIERTFDPSWSVALDVFDQLRANDMICGEISSCAFGQLILLEGSLNVYDIAMLKTMYRPFLELAARAAKADQDAQYQSLAAQLDSSLSSVTGQQRQQYKQLKARLVTLRKQSEATQEQQRKQAEALFDIVGLLPHALQATIEGALASAWMTLSPDQMVTSPDDFALKHGSSIPGIWSVIGTLDTRPTPVVAQPIAPNLQELLQQDNTNQKHADDDQGAAAPPPGLTDGATPTEEPPSPQNIVQGMKQMQDGIRSQFGRPDTFYGITPIAIYRSIAPASGDTAGH